MKAKHGNLSQRLVRQYLITLLALAGVLVIFVYLMRRLFMSRVWYGTELLYSFLSRVNHNLVDTVVITCLFT